MASQNIPPPQHSTLDLDVFDSVPLFMKSLPSEDADDTAIQALQSLVHEGTPDEVAQNFKEQGNDYFKGRRYREALGFYTQGIEAGPSDHTLQETLFCNRAACNLELKNYGSVLRDCSKALTINPRSPKAYYRSALALMALQREDEALDCCDIYQNFDHENDAMKMLRVKVAKAKDEKERKEREREQRIRKEAAEERRLSKALKERHIFVVNNSRGPSDNPYAPHFDSEDSTWSTLVVPVFFLYPQYATSDIVSHFVEDTPFAVQLSAMFPPDAPAPEWDEKGEYVDGKLSIYALTKNKRLLKVGRNMTLRDVFKAAKAKEGQPADGLELKDGCLTFVVVPKGGVEQKWVEDYKKLRDN